MIIFSSIFYPYIGQAILGQDELGFLVGDGIAPPP